MDMVAKEYVHGPTSRKVCLTVSNMPFAPDPCLSCSTHAVGQMPLEITIYDHQGNLDPDPAAVDRTATCKTSPQIGEVFVNKEIECKREH